MVETDGDNVVLHDFSWTYDAKDNVTALTESIGGKSFSYTYAYDDDSRPTTFGYGDVTEQVTYDGHGRSSGTTVKNGSRTVLGTGYAYRDVDSTYTTTQVKSVTNSYGGKTANFNYTYDANGNITSISGAQTAVYEYDDLGQLITETIGTGDEQVIIRYTYDNGGNLIKKVREYTTEAPEPEPTPEPEPEPTPVPEPEPEPDPTPTPTPTPTPEPTPKPSREPIPINPPVTPTPSIMSLGDSDTAVNSSDRVTVQEETLYTYGDAEWGDLLTAYNGEEITYDGIGNPLSYRGWTMSWQGGRQLASMTKGSDTLNFVYNESGLRTSKTVNGVTHSYIWQGSKLAADITDSYALYFHYDSSGEVIGFTRTANGTDTECMSIKDVILDPTNPWAWVCVAGDVVDLIPFVTGVGETARAIGTTVKYVDDVLDTAKTAKKAGDLADDIKNAVGTYDIIFATGKNYAGKGGFGRMIQSARRIVEEAEDYVVAMMWKPALNNKMAFEQEYLVQMVHGVLGSDVGAWTYNKIWSPGRNFIRELF